MKKVVAKNHISCSDGTPPQTDASAKNKHD
jgi:hypothetical protein